MTNNMRRLITAVILILAVAGGCKKEDLAPTTVEPNDNAVLTDDGQQLPLKSLGTITLTVNCLTSRSIIPGNSFTHEFIVKDGTTPIVNAQVNIVDPITMWCTFVKTNSLGKATYTTYIPTSTPRKAYTFKFFYGSAVRYSTVAVAPTSGFINASTYKMDFNTSSNIGSSTLVSASRGGYQYITQRQSTTLQKALSLGVDIVKDYTKNPGNLVISAVFVVSCSVGQIIPGAGQAACATSFQMVSAGVATSTAKVFAKYAIDANANWTISTKTSLKAIVDLSATAVSFARFKPNDGVKALGTLPLTYNVLTTNYGQLIYDSLGILRGAVVAVPISGCNDVIMMGCYKR
jgi:hypothetical protein